MLMVWSIYQQAQQTISRDPVTPVALCKWFLNDFETLKDLEFAF